MKILLLSAYDALSHQYWRKGLVRAFPEHDWTVLSLPARYFSWRLRGNSLSWAFGERETLSAGYDLLICTSMTDLSALKGLVPELARVPTLCYFHENQFAYPFSQKQQRSVEPLILNLYTALAADTVLFNTGYNRQTLLDGVKTLLKKLPDFVPANTLELIRDKSFVLPVPLPDNVFLTHQGNSALPLQVVFNHRWEYDKAPERMYAALQLLVKRQVPFRVHVVGQSFRQIPDVFSAMKQELEPYIGRWGYIDSVTEYRSLLQEADVVLSTAIHDFQGIAVLEGVAAGCRPVVPDRLAYPELFARCYRYSSFENDPGREALALADHLEKLSIAKQEGQWGGVADIEALSWSALTPGYRDWLEMATNTNSIF
ncbi:glycosyl transferase family 1 [Endozoicomonas sp. (ex Bugula neritina AB1)]|nr:glycosyl transferase family 1 [Endozoicomonas sp. (ex Bugula neritina AB1)]